MVTLSVTQDISKVQDFGNFKLSPMVALSVTLERMCIEYWLTIFPIVWQGEANPPSYRIKSDLLPLIMIALQITIGQRRASSTVHWFGSSFCVYSWRAFCFDIGFPVYFSRDFFLCSQNIPISNGIRWLFRWPIWKKIAIFLKNFFLKIGNLIESTHTSYMVTFSFNLMAIVCVIANLFFIDQKWHNCAL